MRFTPEQREALLAQVPQEHVRIRQANGRELRYIEGWYAVAEANRIFGFGGWSRETVELRCIQARELRGVFSVLYMAKARISVMAGTMIIVREGSGSGEAKAASLGEAHDLALKCAETDATKRALATFGSPFGLDLYRRAAGERAEPSTADSEFLLEPAERDTPVNRVAGNVALPGQPPATTNSGATGSDDVRPNGQTPAGLHPDDTTPIPRPSTYFGRQCYLQTRGANGKLVREAASVALHPGVADAHKRDVQLPFGKTIRVRDKAHLKFVASQPCLLCGRAPADAHHLRFAQPRALGRKVSDEFTVPLCRTHHRELHQNGDEAGWWEDLEIDALAIARSLWEQTRSPPLQPEQNSGSA